MLYLTVKSRGSKIGLSPLDNEIKSRLVVFCMVLPFSKNKINAL